MRTAHAGDTLLMTNGTWSNAAISFAGYGTSALPIVLRAETYGSVILSGTSTLSISGKYLLVDGLVFQNGYSPSGPVIGFQGSNGVSDSCRLTNCSILEYNPADLTSDIDWISLYGSHNRVDHCYLRGKANKGVMVVVWCDTTKSDYHQIDHNYFGLRTPLTDGSGGWMNGFETIRIGTGAVSTTYSYTVVENNLFYKCDGDAEFISNKSNGNTYRYNTFLNCQGMLSMRQGNGCTIQGNFILGNRATGYRGTGGIRLTGNDHVVFDNYVSGVNNNKAASALALMDGTATGVSPSYPQVKRAKITFNTFVDNDYSIALGVNNNGGTVVPDSNTIANNLVYTTASNPLISVYDTPTNLIWQGDYFYGGSGLGITNPGGITQSNPKMSYGSDTLWRPASSSPVINASVSASSYPYVSDDMDGQARDATPDIGADEYSAASKVRKPLTTSDVGPTYLATSQPTTQSSSVVFANIGSSSATLNCTAGNGVYRIIIIHAGSAVTSGPADFTSYSANSTFGAGSLIGTGNYAIYAGSGTTVTITGLTATTTYYANVYEFNGSGGNENYLTTSPATNFFTTSATEPTVQTSNVTYSSVSTTSFTINCTAGNGTQRIIVVSGGSAVTANPVDNVTYTANSIYGSSGSQIGTGNYVVYKGSGTSVVITGLTAGTTYYANIYELNGSGGTENYLTINPATGNITTSVIEPTVQATNIQFSSVTSSSLVLSFTKGNGAQRVIVARAGNAVNADPTDNTTYTANSTYGSGSIVGTGNYIVYRDTGSTVTVTGLSSSTTYYFNVYEFNGNSNAENYLTTNPATGSRTTLVAEPTVQAANVQFTSVSSSSFTVSCTKGNGTQRIFVIHSASAVSSDPIDNTTYIASSTYGAGSMIGTGNYIVYKDTGSTVTVTGVASLSIYYINVYEYNGSGGTENYLTVNPASASVFTPALEPTVQATNVQFSALSAISFTINCAKGNGAQRIILLKSGSSVSSDPMDNATYTASSVFGSGSLIGSGNYVVYKDTGSTVVVTGLTASTNYYVKVYELNGGSGSENYLLTNPAANSITTLPNGIHATSTGNWSSSGTWTGGVVPGGSAYAVIDSGVTVTLDANATVIGLVVNTYGTLNISATHTLSGNIIVYGAVAASGTSTITTNGNITCTGANASFKTSSGGTVFSGTVGKIFTLGNGATFQTSMNTNPFGGCITNLTWVIDNSVLLTTIIIKNSGVTSIVNPPNGQEFGNLQLTCSGGGNNKIFSIGENLNILGDLLIADGNTTTTPTNFTTWNLGTFSITTTGAGKTLSVTQAAAGTSLLIKGAGSSLFNGFSSTNFIAPANSNCTVIYAGTSQSIAGGAYQYLADSSGGTKTLSGNVSVSGTLTMASGIISLGSYNLTLSNSITGSPSSSNMIITSGTGEIRKLFSTTPSSFTFPVGTGSTYSPVKITLSSGTLSSAYIGVKVAGTKSSHNTSSSNFLNRTWLLSANGISNPVYSDSLSYAAGDVTGTESSMVGGMYNGSSWSAYGNVNSSNHAITASDVTSFGEITAGESSAFANSGQVNVKIIPQGFYNVADFLNTADTISVYLAQAASPYNILDSSIVLLDSLTFTASAKFNSAVTGSYYLVVKHRNSVETWSASAISFVKGSTIAYDFTDSQNKAYGNNLVQVSVSPVRWAIYGGDVNQDGYMDPLDMSLIDQDSFNYVTGIALATDINGDHYIDPLDMSIADQNSFNYVGIKRPVSAKSIKTQSRAQQGIHYQDWLKLQKKSN